MKKIALIGPPNSGKSSLFNELTGLNQRVGNFPGVTVDRKSAVLSLQKQQIELIDLPGTNSLYPTSRDEQVSCEILRDAQHPDHPDLVLVVADATQLKRGLMLCTQVMDLGLPTALVINMIDLLEQGVPRQEIDQLSHRLGIPIFAISVVKKEGIKALKHVLGKDLPSSRQPFMKIPSGFQEALAQIKTQLDTSHDYLAYQALLVPQEFHQLNGLGERLHAELNLTDSQALISNEMLVRFDKIEGLMDALKSQTSPTPSRFARVLDQVLIHPIWGYAVFGVILFVIFQALFSWASFPMDAIEQGIGSLQGGLKTSLPTHWMSDLLVEGIIAGLGGIVIFIPQIAFLFLFIAILEESGYMSRVVFLMDRLMRPFGMSGKSVIPLIGGMACAIPSIMMARNIPHRHERLITILVTPLMSCAARIPVYVLLIAMFVPSDMSWGFFNLQGLIMMGLYLLGFLAALAFAFIFKKLLKYNNEGIFITEMPVYRIPRWKQVFLTIYQKCKAFVWEAGRIILLISIALWFLASYGPSKDMELIELEYSLKLSIPSLDEDQIATLKSQQAAEKLEASYAGILGHAIEPAIKPLGFDWKIGVGLLTSFAAREVFVGTMATLYSVGEDNQEKGLLKRLQQARDPVTGEKRYSKGVAIALLLFYAFAMQCMSTLAVAKRETGTWKWPLLMVVYMTGLAYLAAWVAFQTFG